MTIGYATSKNVASKTLNSPVLWTRPSDWLTLPSVGPTEEKVNGLYAIFPDNTKNVVGVQFQGSYTVDWGDGSVTNHSNNTIAIHSYDYATIPSSTLTSEGFKQVIITITPQAGQTLTQASFRVSPNANAGTANANWLDIEVGSPNLTNVALVGGPGSPIALAYLARFRMASKSASYGSFSQLFNYCFALKQVVIDADTSTIGTTNQMFQNCRSLQVAPYFNTSAVTNMGNMFRNCSQLMSVPAYDYSKVTTLTETFALCYNLKEVNINNTSKVTNADRAFQNCNSLIQVSELNLANCTSTVSMFQGCISIPEVKIINADKVSNAVSTFNTCSNLAKVTISMSTSGNLANLNSMFNTCASLVEAPTLNTTKVTNIGSIFTNCRSLTKVPAYDTANITSFASVFNGCDSLVEVPVFNTSNVTSFDATFNACPSLTKAPFFNTNKATTVTNMYTGCRSLTDIPAYNLANVVNGQGSMFGNPLSDPSPLLNFDPIGLRFSINLGYGYLGKTELESVFENLATAGAASQTITITNNYGADAPVTSNLTAGQAAGSTVLTVASSTNFQIGEYVTNAVAFAAASVTFQDSTDTVTRTAHGLSNGTRVGFPTITTTTGITINTLYYVINATTDTFQLATTPGGSAIALTNDGSGTIRYEVSIIDKPSSTQVTVSAPTTATTTATALSARFLNTYIATLKNWTVTG